MEFVNGSFRHWGGGVAAGLRLATWLRRLRVGDRKIMDGKTGTIVHLMDGRR